MRRVMVKGGGRGRAKSVGVEKSVKAELGNRARRWLGKTGDCGNRESGKGGGWEKPGTAGTGKTGKAETGKREGRGRQFGRKAQGAAFWRAFYELPPSLSNLFISHKFSVCSPMRIRRIRRRRKSGGRQGGVAGRRRSRHCRCRSRPDCRRGECQGREARTAVMAWTRRAEAPRRLAPWSLKLASPAAKSPGMVV